MRDFKFTSKQSDIKPIMMVYGSPGVGKTTMTKSIPNKVIFDLNHGTSGYDMDSDILDIGNPSPEDLYNTIVEALYFIYNSLPDKKWIVIDTVHELEKAIMDRVIKENPTLKTSKGLDWGAYSLASEKRYKIFNMLERFRKDKDIGTVFIAHRDIKKIEVRDGDSYNYVTPDLSNSIMSFYGQRLDHIIYVEKSIIVDAKNNTSKLSGRFAFYEESGLFLAKSRIPSGKKLPINGKTEFTWSNIIETISPDSKEKT